MVSFLLIAKCITLLIQPGLGYHHDDDAPKMPTVRGFPGLEAGSPQNLVRCWKSVPHVPLCEIQMYLFLGRGDQIGPECCRAILSVTDRCWAKIFPGNPTFIPRQPKHACYTVLVGAAAEVPSGEN
ncbi:hypothetical protein Tsubulata_009317 [Turnera subulata]|uniref:Prolamin-like domain-containing protein n=1 Tax=Turnera subulata TaxID=218843 RepID=A0A9Q0J0N6_9ROSI|nr:hypothetical protein Tsubulata_009317 [Turnera subulata]